MKIFSPAKINLFLQINHKRSDGYHDLASLMCCVSLYDEITLEFGTKRTQISCCDPQISQDESNLAHQAAVLFFTQLKKNEGVKITIKKRIPVAAGLGGGSSNAASVLLGLNRYYGQPFSTAQLMSMGLSLGADVPFFVFRKPAIATGIGEKLQAYSGLNPFPVLLIYPGFTVSTSEIYRKLNLRLTKCKKKLRNNFLKKCGFNVALHLCNDLETVTASAYPEINLAKEQLLNFGALGALMSGSGPVVFGIFSDVEKAKNARNALSHQINWRLFLTDMIVDSGVTLEHT